METLKKSGNGMLWANIRRKSFVDRKQLSFYNSYHKELK